MRAFKALRGGGRCAGVCVAMGLVLLMASGATAAQTKCLVVGAGGSFGTLQAAVDAASAGDTLKVRGTCYGDTTISKDLTIVGESNPGFGPATLNGGNNYESPGSVIVNRGATVAVTGLTITGGDSLTQGHTKNKGGGGVRNEEGSLTLTNSTVTRDYAGDGYGGGIGNGGSLTLKNSTVTDNGAFLGGGISNEGSLTLKNSTVTRNQAYSGGGIYNYYGSVTLANSTVADDYVEGDPSGGITNYNGSVTLTNSTVTGNQSGGISNEEHGSVTLTNSTVADNVTRGSKGGFSPHGFGGGILNGGSLTLTNSTVADNSSNYRGGGISNGGSLTLTNSTVTGNVAPIGGGIDNEGSTTLNNSTVTGNTAPVGQRFIDKQESFGGVGGGIFNGASFRGTGSLALNGSSSVSDNVASEHGGGIYNDESGGATITYGSGWSGTVSGNIPDDIFNF